MTGALFPASGIAFLRDLAANNNRDWFQANKAAYERDLKAPTQLLAEALAEGLADATGRPFSHKIFPIYRDVRFSKDKTPYNTHVRLAFWPTDARVKNPMGGPAFYLSVEPEELIAGGGAIGLAPDMLARFRTRMADTAAADTVARLLDRLQRAGLRVDPPELKRLPGGLVAKTEAQQQLMRRKGLTAWRHSLYASTPVDLTVATCMGALMEARVLFDHVSALAAKN